MINKTSISPAGVQRLIAGLPNCRVEYKDQFTGQLPKLASLLPGRTPQPFQPVPKRGPAMPNKPIEAPAAPISLAPERPASGLGRAKVPADAKLKQAEALIRETFADDYKAARKPEEKTALAEKLLNHASQDNDDPIVRYTLLREAARLGVETGSAQTIESAIGALALEFEVDSLALVADYYEEMLDRPRLPAAAKTIAQALLPRVETAIRAEAFETATRLNRLLLDAARKSREASLVKQAVDINKDLLAKKDLWDALLRATDVLKDKPEDPAANFTLGRYLCFVKGDWERGLPQLAKCDDAQYRALAASSVNRPADAAAQVELADTWWKAAESAGAKAKPDFQAGAAYWYQQALPNLSGLVKLKVEQRLKQLPAAAGADHPFGQRGAGN